MEGGTSTGTLMLIGIIIFGIFVVIAYWLFQDQIQALLNSMMESVKTIVDQSLLDNEFSATPGGPEF